MGTGVTILVAAANQQLAQSIQTLLQVHQFQATIAVNSDQLLELSGQEYDLIIFGPRFLGDLPIYQLQELVKSISPKTKIILLSFPDTVNGFDTEIVDRYLKYQKVSVEPDPFIQYMREHYSLLSAKTE